MPDAKPKLGILFVINYFVYTHTTAGILLNSHVDDIENGFFNLSSYNNDETIKYCFIRSTRALKKDGTIADKSDPATKIYIPEYDKIENKYKIKAEAPEVDLGNINLGNHDVLSTVLIMAKQMLNADEYIIVTYSHGSPFGIGSGNIDEASKVGKSLIPPFFKKIAEFDMPEFKMADFRASDFKSPVLNIDYISGISSPDFADKGIDEILDAEIAVKSTLKVEKHNEEIKDDIKDSVESFNPGKPIDIAEIVEAETTVNVAIKAEKHEDGHRDSIENFKPDMLTNAEQHVALARAFPEQSIKIIINCACYVQNVDTLFSLHQIADYIVAASSSIPELSFDFAKIINDNIAKKEPRDYRSIAQNIVAKYNYLEILKPFAEKIKDDKIKETFKKQNDHIVLSAIDCKELVNFFAEFNEFILLLINQIADKSSFENLRTAKDSIVPFEMERIKKFTDKNERISKTPFYMYDLKMFLNILMKAGTDDLNKHIDNKIVLEKFISPELLVRSQTKKENWGGFAFYFPDEIDVSKSLTGLSKFYSVFSDLESFLSQKGYIQEFIFLYHKRKKILDSM